jgi:hypothetical protein
VAGYESPDEEPSDSEIREADAQLFALVGVKDETTFARRASLVIVERGGAYVVEPWGRDRSGWYPLKETTHIHLSAPSEDAWGRRCVVRSRDLRLWRSDYSLQKRRRVRKC